MSYLKCLTMLCAVSLLASCGTKPKIGASEGAGFTLVTVKEQTALYLVMNDKDAAIGIAANNRACRKAPSCKK